MDKLKLAIIGFGAMGKIHYKAVMKNNSCSNPYVVDSNPDSIKGYENINYFKNLDEVINDKIAEIDGVILSTPSLMHLEHSINFIENDIPLLIEKPLTSTENDDNKILDMENTANSAMSPTDWYVTRKSEVSTAIPSNVTAYRTACRLVCNSTKTAIGNASDLAGLIAIYTSGDGISDPNNFTVDGSATSVVNTTSNTITKSGHGLTNDEMLTYSSGVDGSGDAQNPIGGLVDGNQYYVIGKTTNTFKLSHTNSHMGDAAAISLTGVGGGTSHTFSSQGIPPVGASMPTASNLAYGIE